MVCEGFVWLLFVVFGLFLSGPPSINQIQLTWFESNESCRRERSFDLLGENWLFHPLSPAQ